MKRAKEGFAHESQQALSVDWYTPPWIFETMGLNFDLDPCAPNGGVPWIPADYYYTEEDDGLNSEWEGRVWLNPPYGKDTPRWLARMHEHRNGVAIVFSRTDCKWFFDYVMQSDAILFLRGRVKFVDGLGATSASEPVPVPLCWPGVMKMSKHFLILKKLTKAGFG